MDGFIPNGRLNRVKEILPEFLPRPNTGRLWQDCLFLLVIVAVQISVVPALFGSDLILDLVTPWLVTSFVNQRAFPSIVLAFIGAMAIESHSAFPAGFYICGYWILATVTIQARPTLSWRHKIPWIVNLTLAEIWIISFEILASALISKAMIQDFSFWFFQILRIPLSCAFGLLISRKWLALDADEPVPQ